MVLSTSSFSHKGPLNYFHDDKINRKHANLIKQKKNKTQQKISIILRALTIKRDLRESLSNFYHISHSTLLN